MRAEFWWFLTEFRWQLFEWYGPGPTESYIPAAATDPRWTPSGGVHIVATRTSEQGCKIRSGRDRIIRIIAIGIWSEIIKILLAFLESKWKKPCSHSVGIRQKFRNLTNHQHFLRNLAKFRENSIKIGAKLDENCEKHRKMGRKFENCKIFPTKIC